MNTIDFRTGTPTARPIDVRWIHGSESAKHNTDPDIQVYAYDEHTVILRQNKAVHYEAPFLYLFFGADRAVLIDTGATASPAYFPLRATVDGLIDAWLAENPRDGYELLVLHTHGHGDHKAGDPQFADRPATRLVPADRDAAFAFLGLDPGPDADPDTVVPLDLGGGRVLDCFAIPGHHAASVAFHDRHTGFLLTGDTVYPGRLYVEDWAAFTRSIDRLIAFAATRPVTHVLGCHIEMTATPSVEFRHFATHHPDEHRLELTVDHLHRIRAAIEEIGDKPGEYTYPDFAIHR
ncbi:MBL fold metallo-hydrolase [Kitasatospora sp. NPDC096147]|uniref:MBL fold metallo-hydrolase n=1 Tax=Kitasatospora sp. NPDC096147 TaxID=3364093 RepID=UPI0037F90BD0